MVQLVGLLSAWLARAGEGLAHQKAFQWLFFASLTLVAGATMLAMMMGPGFWLTSGITLSLMVVTAIFDAGDASDAMVW